jgi:hypothetical protein
MYELNLIQFPSEKWGFVGSVPIELCQLKINHIGQKYYGTKLYNSKEEAEKEAKLNNILVREV